MNEHQGQEISISGVYLY